MNRWKKILCGGLILLLLFGGGVLWWQRENIQAVRDGLQYSSEEIEEKLQENQQAIQDAVSAAPEVVVRDVTEEEKQALKEGTITQEELADRLVESKPSSSDENGVPPQSTQQSPLPPVEEVSAVDPEYQKKVSAIVAEVYVLREQYTIELDNMFEAAKAEYKGMSEEDRSADKLTKWARSYITKASQLERDCDAKMYDIIDRLDQLITENNGDPGILDTVVNTYANEKSLKKAWYMSELEKRGLS